MVINLTIHGILDVCTLVSGFYNFWSSFFWSSIDHHSVSFPLIIILLVFHWSSFCCLPLIIILLVFYWPSFCWSSSDHHFVCLPVPGSNTAPDGGFSSMMLMMLGWLVVATCLYLLRPNSLRNRGDMKPSRNNVWTLILKQILYTFLSKNSQTSTNCMVYSNLKRFEWSTTFKINQMKIVFKKI